MCKALFSAPAPEECLGTRPASSSGTEAVMFEQYKSSAFSGTLFMSSISAFAFNFLHVVSTHSIYLKCPLIVIRKQVLLLIVIDNCSHHECQKKGWTEKRLDERLSWRPLRVRASNHSNIDNFRKIFLLHFIQLHCSGSPHNAIALL